MSKLIASLIVLSSFSAHALEGTWVRYDDIRFHVSSISGVYYSCDGAENTMEDLLKEFGAKDIKVRGSCSDFSGVSQFVTLYVSFSALVPASLGYVGAMSDGKYKRVRVRSSGDFGRGDCQLVEDFADEILPLFHPLSVDDNLGCFPYHSTMWSLSAEVMMD